MASKKRKYSNDYLKFGFAFIEINGEEKPQCVVCTTVLSNEAMKPAKLERHLKTVHPDLSQKPLGYFQSKVESLKKMKLGSSVVGFSLNTKSLGNCFFRNSKTHCRGKEAIHNRRAVNQAKLAESCGDYARRGI